jgi:hypothetical protein
MTNTTHVNFPSFEITATREVINHTPQTQYDRGETDYSDWELQMVDGFGQLGSFSDEAECRRAIRIWAGKRKLVLFGIEVEGAAKVIMALCREAVEDFA